MFSGFYSIQFRFFFFQNYNQAFHHNIFPLEWFHSNIIKSLIHWYLLLFRNWITADIEWLKFNKRSSKPLLIYTFYLTLNDSWKIVHPNSILCGVQMKISVEFDMILTSVRNHHKSLGIVHPYNVQAWINSLPGTNQINWMNYVTESKF